MSRAVVLTVVLIAAMTVNKSFAQLSVKNDIAKKRNPPFVLYLGGGLATYVANINPQAPNVLGAVNKTSAAGTFRLMWHPGYRLRLGFETGYTNFFSYKVKDSSQTGKVSLHAVPLLVVWSMPIIKRISIFAGIGSYLLTSDLKYHGNVHSQFFSLGSNLAVCYIQPVSTRVGLAAEAKWLNAFETRDNMVSLEVQLVWKFFKL